ncbi:MAG: hypothetical protein QXK37_04580 [Candidatus Woesearchaeota archaeon]
MVKWLYIIILVFLLSILEAYALGVTAHRGINFEPNLEESFQICFRNSHNNYFPIEISVTGELAEYITLRDKTLTLGPYESKCTEYYVKLPQSIDKYGPVVTRIIGSQVMDPYEHGMFGAQENIVHKFTVFVPYPGKYISFELVSENVNQGEPVQFTLIATNLGQEDIESAKGFVEIYGADNYANYVTTVETKEKPIKSLETIRLYTFLQTADLKSGSYKAIGVLKYDGEKAQDEDTFNIGQLQVIINDYTRNLTRGRINKFDINISSAWNNRIERIYGEASITGVPSKMITPTIVLDPWTTNTLTGYLEIPPDTPLGEVDGKITLYFENTTTKNILVNITENPDAKKSLKEEPKEVKEKSIKEWFSATNIIVILIILFIILDIYLIVHKEKKKGAAPQNKSEEANAQKKTQEKT